MAGIYAGIKIIKILPRADGHYNFFERGVTCTLSQPVDGALYLTSTLGYRCQRVGNGKTQIVMAMHRENGFISIGNTIKKLMDSFCKLLRYSITNRIGDINRVGASIYGRLNNSTEKIQLRPASILTGELNVIDMASGTFYRPNCLLYDFVRQHLQLVLHVDGRCCNKRMYTAPFRGTNRFSCPINVLIQSSSKTANC